jgi:hypothetical protein
MKSSPKLMETGKKQSPISRLLPAAKAILRPGHGVVLLACCGGMIMYLSDHSTPPTPGSRGTAATAHLHFLAEFK